MSGAPKVKQKEGNEGGNGPNNPEPSDKTGNTVPIPSGLYGQSPLLGQGQKPSIITPPVHQMRITLLQTGDIQVDSIPANFRLAMDMLTKAIGAVSEFFVKNAMEGRITARGEIETPMIVRPKMNG